MPNALAHGNDHPLRHERGSLVLGTWRGPLTPPPVCFALSSVVMIEVPGKRPGTIGAVEDHSVGDARIGSGQHVARCSTVTSSPMSGMSGPSTDRAMVDSRNMSCSIKLMIVRAVNRWAD